MHMMAKITFTNNNQKLHGVICKPTRSTNNYNRPRGEGEPSHSIRVRAPHQKPKTLVIASPFAI
jgi:hypothetical protein